MALRYSAVAENFLQIESSYYCFNKTTYRCHTLRTRLKRLGKQTIFLLRKHIAWLWQHIFCMIQFIVQDSVPSTALLCTPRSSAADCTLRFYILWRTAAPWSLSHIWLSLHASVDLPNKTSCVARFTKSCAASHWTISINCTSQRCMVSRWIMEEHFTD